MECYVHPGTAAIGTCVACGHFVCDVCRVNVRGKITCKACVERGEAPVGRDASPLTRRQLRRSSRDKVLGGVAGGVAEHLDLDPTVVRIVWALCTLLAGAGLILYLILWAFLPLEDEY